MIAPLSLLCDYTFRPTGASTKEEALELTFEAGVIRTGECLLHRDPHPSRDVWCRARLTEIEARLAVVPEHFPAVLLNHFPLVREPAGVFRHSEFAPWCGTETTEGWPGGSRAAAVVYGHLRIPRLIRQDGVPHYEVSLGHLCECAARAAVPGQFVRILSGEPDVSRSA